LTIRKDNLQRDIESYKSQISKISYDTDYVLEMAMKKHGFNHNYLLEQQEKNKIEAEKLRVKIISDAKDSAKKEIIKIKKELTDSKEQIDNQLRQWRTNRKEFKEFKKFILLKNKIGEHRAEFVYAPLHIYDEAESTSCSPEMIESAFWRLLKEYEKIKNPIYKLSDYNHLKTQKGHHRDDVDTFLMNQRIIYGL